MERRTPLSEGTPQRGGTHAVPNGTFPGPVPPLARIGMIFIEAEPRRVTTQTRVVAKPPPSLRGSPKLFATAR
jgi:hypothetical protein